MNDNEHKVLAVLSDDYGSDYNYHCFASLSALTGLEVRLVRRACRSLARKGLTRFQRGLWTEDGEPAGSGYAVTKDGAEAAESRKALESLLS